MPASLRALIGLPAESPFWPWQPEMRYHVVGEGAYPAATLIERDSLAALLFRLEHCYELDQLVPLIDAVIGWFDRYPGFAVLKSAFAMLAERLIVADGDASVPRLDNLLEARTMLAARAEEWKRQLRFAGLQEGLEIGREEGHRQGEAAILLRQLDRRFGTLPDWVRERVAAGEPPMLEEWGLRLLDAPSPDDVFRSDHR
jgi:hypothetical protein